MPNMKILIVDDDMKYADNLKKYLEILGYTVFATGTGELALQILKANNIDVLFCDIKLPDIEGDMLVKKIIDVSKKTKLFIVSGYIDSSLNERMKKLGICGIINKPVMFDEVVASLEALNIK